MSEQIESNVKEEVAAEESVEKVESQPEQEQDSPRVSQLQFEKFQNSDTAASGKQRIDLIMDIVLPVSIELGRTKMFIKNILELERGSIIELDKMAGEPVDLYINNKKMAEGEVVVVDKHFGIRITNLIETQDRIKNLTRENLG